MPVGRAGEWVDHTDDAGDGALARVSTQPAIRSLKTANPGRVKAGATEAIIASHVRVLVQLFAVGAAAGRLAALAAQDHQRSAHEPWRSQSGSGRCP